MERTPVNKSERLVNLTMALLASKRFLTKEEVFATVEGYQGSPETKERMFERDKTDLRELGLHIEVGSQDLFFEDEPGYRINPTTYALTLPDLDEQDFALLSLAAVQWRESILEKSSQRALRKLEALHGAIDLPSIDLFKSSPLENGNTLGILWAAIRELRNVSFEYRSSSSSNREVSPHALFLDRGFWYLVALDIKEDLIKTYKLSRIVSGSIKSSEPKSFTRAKDFRLNTFTSFTDSKSEYFDCEVLVARGRAFEIRQYAEIEPYDADWEKATLTHLSRSEIFELVSKAGESAKMHAPENLVEEFVSWILEKANV